MIITSTNEIKSYKVNKYLGLINVNIVVGVNFFSDFFASITDVFGGYSTEYQSKLDKIYGDALYSLETKAKLLNADAIIGVHFDFDEISGKGKQMFMVTAYGTAVKIEPLEIEIKKTDRYEVYERLYNLSLFKEKNIITEEQYEEEKKNLLYRHEEEINAELENIKSENMKEAIMQAQLEFQEKQRHEAEKLKEERRKEEEAKMSEKEKFALLRKEKEQEIQKAIDEFKVKAPAIVKVARDLLINNVKDPRGALNIITKADISNIALNSDEIDSSKQAAYNIGVFLKQERYAEALSYYMLLVGDDDIDEAKSYVNSVYDLLTFKNISAFETMGKNLVELKVLNKTDEAIELFESYALCSRDIAEKVINLI